MLISTRIEGLGMIPSESQEQKALVQWLNYHPILKNYFCKISNEGLRSLVTGARFKLEGLRAGVPDLFIYYPVLPYYGLWLELKQNRRYRESEKRTKTWIAQKEFIETVRNVGYYADFCYGWEDGKRIVEEYLKPVVGVPDNPKEG